MTDWIGTLELADKTATLSINGFDSAFTDATMPLFSNRFIWIPLYILLLIYMIMKLGWRKTLVIAITVALSVAAVDQMANLVKYSVHRLRPCWDPYMIDNGLHVLENKGGRYGFFSAHAATTAGVATVVLNHFWHWGSRSQYNVFLSIFAVWVLMISVSRIYVGKHFLGDVMVGIIAGIVIAFIISEVSRLIVNKYFVKFVS